MLSSMTGYANGTIALHTKNGDFALEIEIKTINSRYYEALCKLPPSFSFLEIKMVNILQEKLIRGRTYLTLRFCEGNEAFEALIPSMKIVEGYITASKAIKDKFGLQGELAMMDIMTLPNVFVQQKSELSKTEQEEFFIGFNELIDKLVKNREAEGLRLEKDLELRFESCKTKIVEIEKSFKLAIVSQKHLIDEQLKLTQNGDDLAKKQLEELMVGLNKMDIQEEITRFNSHLKSVRNIFADKSVLEKGKHLDFILQELLREINTLMAKCPNFNISSIAVDVKVELEKAREQIQNIV
ncbi:MAG: TIGR00255 family protein [candidate division TM6 bacterium GW2011_GWF2_37_49]|nr:MAG: TIGR00255 family protein [candidate division TM6 bacterium GW2011_GWF2_37_49]